MPTTTQTAGKHLLVIDDDDLVRILLQETFWIYATEQYIITNARSIREAESKIIEDGYPEVVFIGLALLTTRQDGSTTREVKPSLTFIHNLKDSHPQTKVIVYTKHNEETLKEQALASGADAYLVKGECTPSELVDFIESL